jgi:hypothetical protein
MPTSRRGLPLPRSAPAGKPAPVFFCTHARKACIHGLLAISIPGQGAHCSCENCVPRVAFTLPPEATQKQGPRHVRLQVLHFVLPNASASHMQAHSHIVGHERTQPGHQTRESVRRAPPVRSHAGPLIGLRHPPDNADCVTRTRPRSHHSLPHPPDNADCVTRTRPRSHHSLPSSLAHDHPFAYASTIFLRTSFFSRRTVSYKSLKVLAVPSL